MRPASGTTLPVPPLTLTLSPEYRGEGTDRRFDHGAGTADACDTNLAGERRRRRVAEPFLQSDEGDGQRGANRDAAERLAGVTVQPARQVHRDDGHAGTIHDVSDLRERRPRRGGQASA